MTSIVDYIEDLHAAGVSGEFRKSLWRRSAKDSAPAGARADRRG